MRNDNYEESRRDIDERLKISNESDWLSGVLMDTLEVIVAMLIVLFIVFAVSCTAEAAELPSITEPCGMSTEELESVLKHELVDYADEFLQAEENYEINACFLASIAALESGWGRYQFKENNIFGFGKKDFDSVPDCIDYVAWYLRKNYINESGKYYNGATIAGVNQCYCGTEEWGQIVGDIYEGMVNAKES